MKKLLLSSAIISISTFAFSPVFAQESSVGLPPPPPAANTGNAGVLAVPEIEVNLDESRFQPTGENGSSVSNPGEVVPVEPLPMGEPAEYVQPGVPMAPGGIELSPPPVSAQATPSDQLSSMGQPNFPNNGAVAPEVAPIPMGSDPVAPANIPQGGLPPFAMPMNDGSAGMPFPQQGMAEERESPIPGGPTTFEDREITIPVEGEAMTLENFDKYYGDLVGKVEERLNQLSVGGSTDPAAQAEAALPNADISDYASEIDQMSDAQREIRMLKLRLEQAKLAREVYEAIYPDKTEVYENRIKELEQAILDQDAEKQEELDAIAAEKQAAEAKALAAEEQLATLQDELEKVRDELEDANDKIQEAERQAERTADQLEYLGGAGPSGGFGTFTTPDGQIVMRPVDAQGNPIDPSAPRTSSPSQASASNAPRLPIIAELTGIAGRFVAEVRDSEWGSAAVSQGSVLPNGMKVVYIGANGVVVQDKSGAKYPLGYAEPPEDMSSEQPLIATDIPSNAPGVPTGDFSTIAAPAAQMENTVIPLTPPLNFFQE